jgi:tetratricopeptide (TPR) repeat protein
MKRPSNFNYAILSSALVFASCLSVSAQDQDGSGAATLIRQGEDAAATGRWRAAAASFYAAVSKDETNAVGFYNLGVAYYHLGECAKAKVAEEQAIALKEDFANAYVQLAAILAKTGDKSGAQEALRKALQIEPANESAMASLKSLTREAVPKLTQAPSAPVDATESKPPETVKPEAVAVNPMPADENYVDQLAKQPAPVAQTRVADSVDDKIREARGAFEKGEIETARQFLTEATQQDSKSSAACADLGAVLGAAGDLEGEIVKERLALELDENNASAHLNLGWALARKGMWSEALRENEQALKINPELIEAIAAKALAQVELGLLSESKQGLQEAISKHDAEFQLHLALSIVLQKEGKPEQSELELKRAMDLRPNRVETQEWRASFELSKQRFAQAKELYREIVTANPQEAQAWLGLGLALEKTQEPEAALEALEKAVQLSPNDAAAHMAFGLALESRGRAREASEQLRSALKLDPSYELAELHLSKLQGVNK